MAKITTYKELLDRVDKVVAQHGLDLSSGEDLSIGVMNLISIEEHLFFTYNKTKNLPAGRHGEKYLDLLNEVRLMRTSLMKEIIKDYAGEEWCIGKHLLASSMRVMEVGTKELKKGETKKAKDLFDKSFHLYSLFWGLVLSNNESVKAKGDTVEFINEKGNHMGEESVFAKLGNILQKALDCCRE
jgi:hypothetical protein